MAPALREITLEWLLRILLRGRWLVLLVAAIAVAITAVFLKIWPPLYSATMTVAPTQIDLGAASQIATNLERYAELAVLAQVPARDERMSTMDRYVESFGSIELAGRLQASLGLLQTIYVEDWDAERAAWQPPSGPVAWLESKILGFFGYPAWVEPDLVDLAHYLRRRVQIGRVPGSGAWGLRFEHPDPAFAVAVLDATHRNADAMVREATLAQIEGQIAHLRAELAEVADRTRRRALESLLTDQYQAQGLIAADQPFAVEVLVPATAGSTPSSANPIMVLASAAVVGAALGVVLVFLRAVLRADFP
jgi:hypothetical protein